MGLSITHLDTLHHRPSCISGVQVGGSHRTTASSCTRGRRGRALRLVKQPRGERLSSGLACFAGKSIARAKTDHQGWAWLMSHGRLFQAVPCEKTKRGSALDNRPASTTPKSPEYRTRDRHASHYSRCAVVQRSMRAMADNFPPEPSSLASFRVGVQLAHWLRYTLSETRVPPNWVSSERYIFEDGCIHIARFRDETLLPLRHGPALPLSHGYTDPYGSSDPTHTRTLLSYEPGKASQPRQAGTLAPCWPPRQRRERLDWRPTG